MAPVIGVYLRTVISRIIDVSRRNKNQSQYFFQMVPNMTSKNELEKYKIELIEICTGSSELHPFISEIEAIPTPYPSAFFVGKFGVGKTRIINSLLGQDLLPTSIMPTRKFYLRVSYSSTDNKIITLYKEKKSELLLSKDLLDKTISTDEENSILGVEVFGSFEFLETGIDILESPGLGEINPEHERVTKYLLDQAELLFVVLDVGSELIPMEYDFFKNIPSHIKHVFVVLNSSLEEDETKKTLEMTSTIVWNVKKTISYIPCTFVSTLESPPLEFNQQATEQIVWGFGDISERINAVYASADSNEVDYVEEFMSVGEKMLLSLDELRLTRYEKNVNNKVSQDWIDRAEQLISIISDQQRELTYTLIDSFDAEVFQFIKGAPSTSPIEIFFHNRLDNTVYKLNEHLLYWAANQEPLLASQLQFLYDKMYREVSKIVDIDVPKSQIRLDEVGLLISQLHNQTKDNQFQHRLLEGFLEIIEHKTNAIFDLVTNHLTNRSFVDETFDNNELVTLIKTENKIKSLLNRINSTKSLRTYKEI